MSKNIREIIHGTSDYAQAVNLRRSVLRTPLGLDFTSSQLAAESIDTHFAVFDEDQLVATVVLSPYEDNTLKLRQMAVAEEAQGQSLGRELLATCEAYAKTKDIRHIVLAARCSAQGFYEKNGYVTEGEVFEDVTLPHIKMRKTL